MQRKELFITIFGSIFLFLISPYFIMTTYCHFNIPPTIVQFLFLVKLGVYSLFIAPVFFLFLSAWSSRKSYIYFFIFLTLSFTITNFSWMIYSWKDALEYKGIFFTVAMFFINIIFYLLVCFFTLKSYRQHKIYFIRWATLLFFIDLLLFSFPWFGESI